MTIELSLMDEPDLMRRNRRALVVEGVLSARRMLVIEFDSHDVMMNPNGWENLVAAAVEFVRGAPE